MDYTDADMMDSESLSPSPPPPVPAPPPAPEPPSNSDVVRQYLTFARQLIDQGQLIQALEALAMAMRAKGANDTAFQALNRVKDLFGSRIQASNAADELASLFAECAIAESLPSSTPESTQSMMLNLSVEPDVQGNSILAETGRKQIMLDAYSDGSSFVCVKCGGLVSNNRRDDHYAFWCGHS